MIDLFAGAGGLSLGFERAGFRSVAAVEADRDCAETYNNLFPASELKHRDIREVSFNELKGVDLVAGGPPCQPFSSGGKGLSSEDSRDMLPEFIRVIREVRPRAFLLENVPGLAGPSHKAYFQNVLAALRDLEYTLWLQVLNAADYGVPQKRRRLFVVGLTQGKFRFPQVTHGPYAKRPHVTAGKYISTTRTLGEPNASVVVYAKRPDLRPSPYDGQLFNGGGRPINLTAPSHTILAAAGGNKTHFLDTRGEVPPYHAHLVRGGKPRMGVLEDGRRLTVLESALLQSFPKQVRFFGSRSSQYSQVGNAVPPCLAAALGKEIAAALIDA